MGLINPKPRFGYETESGLMYDYVAQRDVPLVDDYSASDGVWDLFKVKDLILSGQTVEDGRRYGAPPKSPTGTPSKPPVPGPGLIPAPSSADTVDSRPFTPATPAALSVAQLLALKLSALQCAALRITPVQMTATGVTAEHVASWGLTAERADALQLTAEQRAALMPA